MRRLESIQGQIDQEMEEARFHFLKFRVEAADRSRFRYTSFIEHEPPRWENGRVKVTITDLPHDEINEWEDFKAMYLAREIYVCETYDLHQPDVRAYFQLEPLTN